MQANISDLVFCLKNKIQRTEMLFLRKCDFIVRMQSPEHLDSPHEFQYTLTELTFKVSGHPAVHF